MPALHSQRGDPTAHAASSIPVSGIEKIRLFKVNFKRRDVLDARTFEDAIRADVVYFPANCVPNSRWHPREFF
jgi:hypothetical protein